MGLNKQTAAKSQAAVSKAEVEKARAALERYQTDLRYATITSPMDGLVLSRDVEVGDAVSSILVLGSQATLVMTLGDVSEVYVLGKVDEADIGRVYMGQRARIVVESFKEKSFEGKVTKISPLGKEKDNVTTFEVRVSIRNPGGELKTNMTANAEIILEEKKARPDRPRVRGGVRQGAEALARGARPEGRGREAQGRGQARHLERRQDRGGRGPEGRRQGRPAVGARETRAMVWTDLFRDTMRTLFAHKLRTLLTMFGIAWGIVSITLMVAAGEGLRVGQAKVAESFSRDVMIVFAGRTSLQVGGLRAGRRVQWTATDHLEVPKQAPACGYVMPELGQTAPVRSAHNSASLTITGSMPDFAYIRSIPVAEGRYPNWDDERQVRRVAFLGSDAKKQLFGNRQAMGETLRIGDFPYTVVGVMTHKEQDSSYDGRDIGKVFLPFSAILQDFPNKPPALPDSVDRLLVAPRSVAEHEACKGEMRRALGRIHEFDPRDEEAAHIWDTVEEAKAFKTMTDGMKYFLGAVGIATLFIGGIGVMNVMLVAVRERTREIGVRKALGATRRSIVRQFVVETLLVVFVSGGTGLAVAYGLCALVNLLPMPPFFAGLLPTWSSGLMAFAPARDGGAAGRGLPGAPRRLDRPDRGAALGSGRLAWSASWSCRAGRTSRATARAACSRCSASCGASWR